MKDIFKSSYKELVKKVSISPDEVEEELNQLSIPEQAQLFLQADDVERLKIIDFAHQPRKLLEKVPATEIWVTIKRMTPEDSLSLIKYATPEQLQVINDIEWWRKDKLNFPDMLEWMEYISACGIGKIIEWFKQGDWEQVLWFFKHAIVVVKREDKESDPASDIIWPRDESPITFEGIYYFQVIEEENEQLIRHFLDILAKSDLNLYHKICESCLWDIPSIREEEAFEIKSRRLAEHGFPPFDEAITIYSPLDEKRFLTLVEKKTVPMNKEYAPTYPLMLMGDRVLLINRVIGRLNEEMQNEFLNQISNIANKVLIADGKDIDEDTLEDSVVKAFGHVNIGLEVLADSDLNRAEELISQYWLENIFQVGLGQVLKLSLRAKKVYKEGWIKGDSRRLELLEPGQQLFLKELFQKRPRYFCGEYDFSNNSVRDFITVKEIEEARKRLAESEFIGRFVIDLLVDIDLILSSVIYPEELRFSGVISTTIINKWLKDKYLFKPVDPKDLMKFIENMRLQDGENQINNEYEKLAEYIGETDNKYTDREIKYLRDFLTISKHRFVSEFQDLKDRPSSRLVNSVWLSE